MKFLLLSVICSSILLVFFKFFEKKSISVKKAIAINYIMASLLSYFWIDFNYTITREDLKIVLLAIILGMSFFLVFNFCGLSTLYSGIGITSLAMKMAVLFPVILGYTIYGEKGTFFQYTGIGLGAVALYLMVYEKESNQNKNNYLYPIIVWIGSGLCDSVVQYVSNRAPHWADNGYFTFLTFSASAISSQIYLIFRRDTHLNLKTIVGGCLLGIPNFFSIVFLLLTVGYFTENYKWNSAAIFPLNNILIVLMSFAIGIFFFTEKLSVQKSIGLILALLSIGLISI